jgi:DNA-binding NarL/FixJ family response regulator
LQASCISENIAQPWQKEGSMKTRVLIVDDHRPFRDGLKLVINHQRDMEVVGEAEDGEKAIALTREILPDVILMDVKMPVMDGAEATSRILAEMPDMKILALSIYDDDGFMANMLRAGAMGYILKGCDSEELSGAIRNAAGSRSD